MQLINSVLLAMVRYWTAAFFLPRKVVKEIESLLRTFLWGSPHKAKIKWLDLCKPKDAGGLGLPNLSRMNNAYLMKQIWSICEEKESLWLKWVHAIILKGSSLWEVESKQKNSWIWKRMLWIRDQCESFIKRVIGRGTSTSFWYDPWHPWGILIKKFLGLKQKLNIPLGAKVSDVLQGTQWNFPFGRGWNNQVIDFYNSCRSIPISNGDDVWRWTPSQKFSIYSALWDIETPSPSLSWTKIVWSRCILPRFAFILWIAFWERLPTLQKLAQWGIVDDDLCHLCHEQQESHSHLFFHCSYSRRVWIAITQQLNCRTIELNWDRLQD